MPWIPSATPHLPINTNHGALRWFVAFYSVRNSRWTHCPNSMYLCERPLENTGMYEHIYIYWKLNVSKNGSRRRHKINAEVWSKIKIRCNSRKRYSTAEIELWILVVFRAIAWNWNDCFGLDYDGCTFSFSTSFHFPVVQFKRSGCLLYGHRNMPINWWSIEINLQRQFIYYEQAINFLTNLELMGVTKAVSGDWVL